MKLRLALFLLSFSAMPAFADPQMLGSYQAWSAYASHDNGQDVCYISAKPIKSEGDYKKRGAAFAEITHRPSDHRTGIFNILGGYIFKSGVPATVEINDKSFKLFTHGDAAFAQDADDSKIIAALRSADTMVVTGTSSHGTLTKDTYSLKGLEAAYQAIGKACGVEATRPAKKPSVKKS